MPAVPSPQYSPLQKTGGPHLPAFSETKNCFLAGGGEWLLLVCPGVLLRPQNEALGGPAALPWTAAAPPSRPVHAPCWARHLFLCPEHPALILPAACVQPPFLLPWAPTAPWAPSVSCSCWLAFPDTGNFLRAGDWVPFSAPTKPEDQWALNKCC